MGNTQLIDSLVDPVAPEQIINLKKELSELGVSFSAATKEAVAFYKLTGNSNNASSLIAANKGSTKSINEMSDASQRQINISKQLQAEMDRQLQKQIEQRAKQEASAQRALSEQAARDAKEIAAAEQKAAKLQAIADEAVRKANRQFPAGKSAPLDITQDGGQTVSAAQANKAFAASQTGMQIPLTQTTEAIAAENAALLEQQEVLGSLTVAQRANIEALLALQIERAGNTAELKALNIEDAASAERAVFLTAEQVRLKIAISQVTVELNRQTKEALAADGAMAKLDQSVLLLRTAYEQLSVAERESESGMAMKAELNALDQENKKLALSVGNTSKQIGDYEKGLGKATSTGGSLGKSIGGILTPIRQLAYILPGIGMAGIFNLAFEALSKLLSGVITFKEAISQAAQNFATINEVMKNADSIAGDNIANLKILYAATQDVSLSEAKRIEAAETLKRLYPDMLKNSSDMAILNGEEADSINKITIELIKEAQADAALQKIKALSGKLIDEEYEKQKVRTKEQAERKQANAVTGNPFTSGTVNNPNSDVVVPSTNPKMVALQKKSQEEAAHNRAVEAIAEHDANERLIRGQIDFLTKFAGLGNLADIIEKVPPKIKATSDKTNTELLEYYRLQLEQVKKNAKLIVDDETQSFETREQALAVYLNASKQLVKNAEATALADKNISAQKRKNIELKFNNELLDVERDVADQRLKIQKEAAKAFQDEIKKVQADSEQLVEDNLNKNLQDIEDNKADEILVVTKARQRGEINEKQYNDRIRKINNDAALERIQDELKAAEQIAAIRSGLYEASAISGIKFGPDAKSVDSANNRVAGLRTDLKKQQTSGIVIDEKGSRTDKEKTASDVAATIGYSNQLEEEGQKIINAGYEQQIALLEQKKQAIQDNADIEIAAINDSLASEKSKADQIALVNARTKAAQDKITQQQNKEKRKEAILEKEGNLFTIAGNIAVAISKTLAEGGAIFGIPLLPIVEGFGAAALIAAAAQPIPSYFTGTKSAKGGMSLVGELGTEFVRTPTGQVFFTPPSASLMDIPRGSEILNAMETKRLQNSGTLPTGNENDEMVAELRRGNEIAAKNAKKRHNPRVSGWQSEHSAAAAWGAYERSIFR